MKAIITFTATAELDMNSPLFPPGCDTDEKKLVYWLEGANEEPFYALQCVGAELKVGGFLVGGDYRKGSNGCILTPQGSLVSRTEGCAPLMELPDTLPDDIDYDWYIREAESLLVDIGVNKE